MKVLRRIRISFKFRIDSLLFPDGEIYPTKKRKEWLASKNLAILARIATDEILDVGVFTNGTPLLYKTFPKSHFHLIEPIPNLIIESLPKNYLLHTIGLSNRNGRAILNVANLSSSYQTRTQMQGIHATTHEIDTEIMTLDSFFDRFLDGKNSFGIKIDTEGGELEVLEGLTHQPFISKINFFILEVSTRARFTNGYLASQIFTWMTINQFEFLTILNIPDRRNFFDFIFVKKELLGQF